MFASKRFNKRYLLVLVVLLVLFWLPIVLFLATGGGRPAPRGAADRIRTSRTGELFGMPGLNRITWSRALIEGGVIVASILLAFGIDAYWDAAQDKSRLHSHLEALQEEVKGVLIAVNRSQAYRERRIGVMRDLLRQITTGERADDDTINEQLGTLWGASRRSGDLATLEMMRSAGTLPLIESDDLRLALIKYQVIDGYLGESETRVVRYWEDEL